MNSRGLVYVLSTVRAGPPVEFLGVPGTQLKFNRDRFEVVPPRNSLESEHKATYHFHIV